MTAASRKVLLVAGEASGDLHGAALLDALRACDASIDVYGIGGEHLRRAGMHVLVDSAAIATMGFVETFGTLGRLMSAYRRLRRFLREQRPALLILIDYPEFNLLLARAAKRMGIPVFYYVAPQVWAWRRGRVRTIARRVDRLGVVFPFEPTLYNQAAGNGRGHDLAVFVGHPLLERVRPTQSRDVTRARYGLDPSKPLLAVLPGSRKKEIRFLLPPALDAIARLRAHGWQSVIALASTLARADIEALVPAGVVPIAESDTYNVVHAADATLVASGTATIETALLCRPMVIMYRVSSLTFALARRLVHVEHIGMPNIVLGRRVFPELIQHEVAGDRLAAAVEHIAAQRDQLGAAFAELRAKLGEPGAATRAAHLALELIA